MGLLLQTSDILVQGMQNKTIAIDARPLARKMSGIRRYTEELLIRLCKDESIQWLLYTDRDFEDTHGFRKKENIKVYVVPCRGSARVLWPLYSMIWLYRHKPDIYWSPRHHLPFFSPYNTVLFLTIHDFVWLESRGTMPLLAYLSERFWTRRSIAKANTILAVSNTTSSKIKEHSKSFKAPIFTITNGYNPPEVAIQPEQLKQKHIGDYFLAVGTLEPRKNYATLITAYHRYQDAGGKKALLIIGNTGWGDDITQLTRRPGNTEKTVFILRNISDEGLRWCYEHANALVSTSLYEGFGIPLIEAQYFALPQLVSDIPPYREIAASGAVFFNPLDIEAITRVLLANDKSEHRNKPMSSTNKYSWDTSASALARLFHDTLEPRLRLA